MPASQPQPLPQPSDPRPTTIVLARGVMSLVDERPPGDAPVPLLLAIHGLPGGHRDFRYLAGALSATMRVVRCDMPGFGDTRANMVANNTVAARAGLLLELLTALNPDPTEPVVVLGHSMGAALACEMAAMAPARIAGVALVAGPGPVPHHTYRKRGLALMSRALAVPGVARLLRKRLKEGYERAGFPTSLTHQQRVISVVQAGVMDFERHGRNMRGLTVPTLCAWAEDDRLIEPEVFHKQAQCCPDGPRLGFETGGHNIQKTRARELIDAIGPWVASLRPALRSP